MTTAIEPGSIHVKVGHKDERVYVFQGRLLITYAEKNQSTRGRQMEVWQTNDDRIVTREISLAPQTHEPTPGNFYEVRCFDNPAAFREAKRSKGFGKRLLRGMSEVTGDPAWSAATYDVFSDNGQVDSERTQIIERPDAPDILLVGEQVCGTVSHPGIGPLIWARNETAKQGAQYRYWRIYRTDEQQTWVIVACVLLQDYYETTDWQVTQHINQEWVEVLHRETMMGDLKGLIARRWHGGYWEEGAGLGPQEVDLITKLTACYDAGHDVARLAYLPLPPIETPAAPEPEQESEPYEPWRPPKTALDDVDLDQLVTQLVGMTDGSATPQSQRATQAIMTLALLKGLERSAYIRRGEY